MKKWKLAIVLLTISVSVVGCAKKYEKVDTVDIITTVATTEATTIATTIAPTEAEETTTEAETLPEDPDERMEVEGKIKSYLTGEWIDIGIGNRRPIAVMLSNEKAACPQSGINDAGIIYEAPAEGGINRLMGIFENYDTATKIGSVRSSRTYYIYFAKEFEAIYAHYGQSTFAKPYLKKIDNLNGVEGIGEAVYYRSKDRKAPHNAYTSFEKLQAGITEKGYSQEYPDSYKGHYQFAKTGHEVELTSERDAYKIVPGYVINKPWFTYDETDKLYYRSQFEKPHLDSEGNQIPVKNIIIQYCEYGYYATTEYLNINVHTSERGVYITNGKAIDITWKKDSEFGPTRYYNKNGEEIVLNQGKTWVCVVPTDRVEKTEIYGK